MMGIELVGNAPQFVFVFTTGDPASGKTGLTVTCEIYDQDETKIINAAACTEIGDGAYGYTLAAASFDTKGVYKGVATTTDATVHDQQVYDIWQALGTLNLTETGVGTGLPLTLSGLRRMLRDRLNDLTSDGNPGGNYSTESLDYAINLAYLESVVRTKCHKTTKSVTLVDTQSTYNLTDMFEPLEVVLGTEPIKHTSIKAEGVSLQTWNSTPGGIPTKWLQLTGPRIRVHPTPDASAASVVSVVADAPIAGGTGHVVNDILTLVSTGASGGSVIVTAVASGVVTEVRLYAGGYGYTTGTKATTSSGVGTACTISVTTVGTLTVNGYSHPTVLTSDAHTVDALPDGFAVQTILDRAELYQRRKRSTHANNITLATQLKDEWEKDLEDIRSSIEAEGN